MGVMLEKSMINCHARGVDSLVIKGVPGMVRVFVARPEHELGMETATELQLGLHSHHCDLVLTPLFGEIFNLTPDDWVYDLDGALPAGSEVTERRVCPFAYSSALREQEPGFVRMGRVRVKRLRSRRLEHPTPMMARELHTILLYGGCPAAWMVAEGREDPEYLAVTYSDADLTQYDFTGMYQPMTAERLAQDLQLLHENGIDL